MCSERGAQLVVGAGTNSTRATVSAVQALEHVPGITAALCVVPYYVRPSQAGIVAHFKEVAANSPVPVVLYNIPVRTGRLLEPDGLLELARTPNIVGVKQAVGGIDEGTLRVLAEAPSSFALLGGDDPFLFPQVLMGGAGAICASAHVCTERFVAMIECGLAGKVDDGRPPRGAAAGRRGLLRGAEPRRVQGRAPRAGPDPHARRAAAAHERVIRCRRGGARRHRGRRGLTARHGFPGFVRPGNTVR